VSQLQAVKKSLLLNTLGAQLMRQMGVGDQEAINDPDIMSLPQIEQYITTEYKDIAEIAAHHTLNYLYHKSNLDHEFMKNWKDALIAGEEVGYVGIINGEPVYERVNPIFLEHDRSPDLEFIEDGDWATRSMWMTAQEIYDRFYDKLTPSDLDDLLELSNGVADGSGARNDSYISYKSIGAHEWIGDNSIWNNGLIRVWHATWKSFKKIGFLTYMGEDGEPQQMVVDESYKAGENEHIEWDWVVEVWEGYKAGHQKFFGIQPLEYQSVSLDNPNSQRLPYCGVMYSNTNSRSRSLVDLMKSLQYFYIILWYRLELMLARDNGKAFLMDINQIPKSAGMDTLKWMHYLKSFGVIFVNPNEKIETMQRPSTFNTFQSIDMTMANVIEGYIQLMDRIEQMASTLSGVTQQREGSISSNELVGNVERSVMQSAHITEWLFWTHNRYKKNVLTHLLNTAKFAYSRYDKQKLHYMTDDAVRVFLDIPEDFEYADFDVFLSDSTKESQNIESIRTLLQPALQNGASLLDAVDIITADNVTILKKKIAEIEQKRMELMQQQQQAEAQQAQQLQQMQQQTEQYKAENQMRIAELQSQTQLQIAQINANSKAADANRNGIADALESKRLELDKYRAEIEASIKQQEMQSKARESDLKAALQQIDVESKAEQSMIDREIAAANLAQKKIDAMVAAKKGESDIAIASANIQAKSMDMASKQADLQQKTIDLDIKEIEREIKRAELVDAYKEGQARDEQIVNERAKTAILGREADNKDYIERAKLLLERIKLAQERRLKEEELDIKEEEMEAKKDIEKIKLQGEKIKIEQTKAQIQKSKADVVKAEKMSELKQEDAKVANDVAKEKGDAKITLAKADKEAAKIKASIPKPKKSKE
jgi:hypothetical protein